jgi:hypothetical protein
MIVPRGGGTVVVMATSRATRVSSIALSLAVAFALLTGCATSYRDKAIHEFRDQLVNDGGVSRPVADCIVDKFFDGMATSDVRQFFKDPELTDTESARFAEIGTECTASDG